MKHTLSYRARFAPLMAICTLAASVLSCGEATSDESVFLYVINGYAGSNGLTLVGPTGTVTNGLKFGERTAQPIEIDRSLGTDFTVLLDGTPEAVELKLELFSMYPQETGTLFLKRRAADTSVAVSLYRHVQTISTDCVLTFENALSLDNNYTLNEQFTFAPEFRVADIAEAGYRDETREAVQTPCGPLPTPSPQPIPRDFTEIAQDPYFFYVTCESSLLQNLLCYQWGDYGKDFTSAVVGPPPTLEYFECISGAIEVKQPVVDPPLPFPPADAQVQCPENPITWQDVNFSLEDILLCQAHKRRDVEPARPGSTGNDSLNIITSNCNRTFRLRSPGLETIFGPASGQTFGSHGNGGFVESTITVQPGSQHFYVLFGRPVNPLIWQWSSGENFVDLQAFPYFNGQDANIGDYNFP